MKRQYHTHYTTTDSSKRRETSDAQSVPISVEDDERGVVSSACDADIHQHVCHTHQRVGEGYVALCVVSVPLHQVC